MNDKTHALKAVPSPDLSPAQILHLAKEDCGVWLELGFEEAGTPGSKLFRAFSEAVSAMGEAVRKEGVYGAIKPFAELCLDMNAAGDTSSSAETLVTEISRREKWLGKMADVQSEVETAIEESETALRKASDAIRFSGGPTAKLAAEKVAAVERKTALEKFSRQLVAMKEPVKTELETLGRYKRALDLVTKGSPGESTESEMPKIPPIPEVSVEEVTPPALQMDSAGLAQAKVSETQVDVPLPNRRIHLHALAESLGLFDLEVLIYSLFDLMGMRGSSMPGRGARGLKRVLLVANEIGIMGEYGWQGNLGEILIGSGWKNERAGESGFLLYCGSPSRGSSMYSRSDKQLPWNSRDLFTEETAAEFVRIMSQKSVPKKK